MPLYTINLYDRQAISADFWANAWNQGTTSGGSSPRDITVTSVLRDRTPAEPEDPLEEAQVQWGGPSNFSWGNTARDFNSDPFIRGGYGDSGLTDPDEEQGDPPPTRVDTWQEVARAEREVRIDGPDGAYVDFMRLDEIVFQLPNLPGGVQHFVVQKFKKFGDEV